MVVTVVSSNKLMRNGVVLAPSGPCDWMSRSGILKTGIATRNLTTSSETKELYSNLILSFLCRISV